MVYKVIVVVLEDVDRHSGELFTINWLFVVSASSLYFGIYRRIVQQLKR